MSQLDHGARSPEPVVWDRADANCARCAQLAEAEHRIANHLAMLAGYVRLKNSELARRKTEATPLDVSLLLKAITVQITAIADLHRILSSDGTIQSADLAAHLGQICAALRASVSTDVQITEQFAPGCALPLDHVLPVAQIFTEVVTNAIKHARRPETTPMLSVSCTSKDIATVTVKIRDNGPGIGDAAPTGHTGLGLRLVASLVEQIGATINYTSTPDGVTVSLDLLCPQ